MRGREEIRRAATAKQAAAIARANSSRVRGDWAQVKNEVMREALRAKFTAHADLRALLLATGDQELVERSPKDDYWGTGASGEGRNELGRLLMEVRAELRRVK